jgi:hypothetical protein
LPEERIAAVEELRCQVYGNSQRLQKVARIVKGEGFTADKKVTGRAEDVADIEALGER